MIRGREERKRGGAMGDGEMDAIRRLIALDKEGLLGGCDCPRCQARRNAMRIRIGGNDARGREASKKDDD